MITYFMTLDKWKDIAILRDHLFFHWHFFQNKGQSIMSWNGWNWQHRQGDSWDVGDTFVGTRLFWNFERILVNNKYIWWCIYILNLNMIIYNKICFDGYKICTNKQETQNKLSFFFEKETTCLVLNICFYFCILIFNISVIFIIQSYS